MYKLKDGGVVVCYGDSFTFLLFFLLTLLNLNYFPPNVCRNNYILNNFWKLGEPFTGIATHGLTNRRV
jgi:hypothetical protein